LVVIAIALSSPLIGPPIASLGVPLSASAINDSAI
jgi:hypothetical protein